MLRVLALAAAVSLSSSAHAATAAVDSKPGPDEPVVPENRLGREPMAPLIQPDRGRMLYENHCLTCHESVVHIRERQRAGSFAEVTSWVVRWASGLELDWRAEEIQDVVRYLNRRFYNYTPYPVER